MKYDITASIVVYHNDKAQVLKTVKSFLNTDLNVKLYIIDNSSNDALKILANYSKNIEYIFNNSNLGYGSAHNKAIKKSISIKSPYHIVLNPDIYFDKGVIEALFIYMKKNTDVANVMPKILYGNGETQYLCKLVPTPFDLIFRRFIPIKSLKRKRIYNYELRFTNYDKEMEVPILSGCFMFLRNETLKDVGLFDERYFMYLEDVDFSRRLHKNHRTMYYPMVSIYHGYEKESYRNGLLLKYHIQSAVKYFNKWGWFLDKKRKSINTNSLAKFNLKKSI